jgi:AmiR/NasT family two-component response regulator
MLAERRQIEMAAAFDSLRAYARNTNQKLGRVAQDLVAGTLSAEALERH